MMQRPLQLLDRALWGAARRESFAAFQVIKLLQRYEAPSAPHMEPESLAYFQEQIARTSVYLEYGSGGSTVLASRYVDHLVTVDNDNDFLECIGQAISGSRAKSELIYADTGIIRPWGVPYFTKPTSKRLERWSGYVDAPWEHLRSSNLEPELILVDGRFRIACTLASLLQSRSADTVILLDDYTSRREQYAVIEEFARIDDFKGRMAVLRKRADFDAARCASILRRSYRDWH